MEKSIKSNFVDDTTLTQNLVMPVAPGQHWTQVEWVEIRPSAAGDSKYAAGGSSADRSGESPRDQGWSQWVNKNCRIKVVVIYFKTRMVGFPVHAMHPDLGQHPRTLEAPKCLFGAVDVHCLLLRWIWEFWNIQMYPTNRDIFASYISTSVFLKWLLTPEV